MYQGFPKMRGPLFDKNVRKADLVHMESGAEFELLSKNPFQKHFSTHFSCIYNITQKAGSRNVRLLAFCCFVVIVILHQWLSRFHIRLLLGHIICLLILQ